MSGIASLFAVHIAHGVLSWPWLVGGGILATGIAYWGGRRIPDADVPRVALLTAVFFVASLVHVRVGPTSVHLLLNGLVGILLGRYAGIAIPVGLFLQALLIGHGGLDALGVNSCVLAGPALVAGFLFRALRRIAWLHHPLGRGMLVTLAVSAWLWCVLAGVELLWRYGALIFGSGVVWEHGFAPADWSAVDLTSMLATQPMPICGLIAAGVACAFVERRLENEPEFALGLLVSGAATMLTLALNALALRGAGADNWQNLSLVVFVAHLPIAAVESIVVGFVVGFLAKVRPEMLNGGHARPSGKSSSNGISH